ncbi:MAG TPA: hypothetical protein VJJ78_03930 [Candidatus Saccharimonadales bacterium]|nr:hypothetical protein [Candidatus Saccharimonadales bacterium]
MKRRVILLLSAISFALIFSQILKPPTALAAFTANNLIEDAIFDDYNSMSAEQIDAFLNARNSCISPSSGFSAPDPIGYSPSTGFQYGGNVSAGTVIAHSSQAYGLNPQVIIVTLQKEQSLITSTSCSTNTISKAAGYGCPDGGGSYSYSGLNLYTRGGTTYTDVSGICVNTASKTGFTQQVIRATWLLKFSQERSLGNINWAVIQGNWDNSDDLAACYYGYMTQGTYKRCPNGTADYYDGWVTIDGSATHMDSGATASLYRYTPHFPGNQNFVSIFESWFGPTTGESYVLATSYQNNGDPRQWVIYQSIRRLVPDVATKIAWGLDNVTLLQWTGTYLGSFPEASQPLTRLMRPSGTLDVYFVDSGKSYKVNGPAMLSAWNFNPASIINVSVYLGRVPANSGLLTYSVKSAADAISIYLVDGGSKRRYSNTDILTAWEGEGPATTTISTAYFNAMGSGSDITGTKITAGSQEYQVVAGQKLSSSYGVALLYPGVAQTVSVATTNRLVTSAPVSQFIRSGDSATTYLVDNLKKHTISSPEVLRAWGVGVNPPVNIVTQGSLNLIPTDAATPLNTFEADVGGQLYLMDGRKISVPTILDSAYRTTGNIYSPTSSLMSLLPAGETASDFIKGFNSSAIYLMDAQSLRNINSPADLTLWNNGKSITSVSDYALSQFSTGSSIGSFISDGTTEYMIQSGTKHSVSAAVKSNWQLPSAATLNSATLSDSRFPSGTALSNSLQNSGKYFRIHEKVAFMTVDSNIAEVWGVKNSPTMDATLVSRYLTTDMMTRFAKSKLSNDGRQFVVDNGVLYHLSPQHAENLGLLNTQSLMMVNPEAITPSITTWSGIVVRDSANKAYVIDNGTKKWLPDGTIRNFWTNSDSISTSQMTNGFLNLLPTITNMERAIKGSGPNIYAGENITKRWIQSWGTYQTSYAPYASISDSLLNALPNGSSIP